MLEPDWLDLDHVTLTVEPCVGQDGYAEPTFSSSGTWQAPAIVQNERRLAPQPDGSVEISTTTLFVLSTSGYVGLHDRLSWPTMAPPSTSPPRILGLDHASDEDGQHHIEVMLG